MASRPLSTRNALSSVHRRKSTQVDIRQGPNSTILNKQIMVEKFLENFRTAMALSGEVKIFEATLPFSASSDKELDLCVGDQCLVHGDVLDESADWIFCEHENGDRGWCPRHSGIFFSFADSASHGAQLRLMPADGSRGVYGLSQAMDDVPLRNKTNILNDCLKSLEFGESLYVKELEILVTQFVQPLELRDTITKIKLLAEPQVVILLGTLRDLFFYHKQFLKNIQTYQNLSENIKLISLSKSLLKLTSRFLIYIKYLSNWSQISNILEYKKSILLENYLQENPLPLSPNPLYSTSSCDSSTSSCDSSSQPEKNNANDVIVDAIVVVDSPKSNLLKRLGGLLKRYRVYKPIIELILRCILDKNQKTNENETITSLSNKFNKIVPNKTLSTNISNAEVFEKVAGMFLELSKDTAAVDLFLKKSRDEVELFEVQNQFSGKVNIFQRGRRLIHCDLIFKVHRKRGVKEQRMVHLFNDVLIYSIPLKTGGFQFRKSISLLTCKVLYVVDQANGYNMFDLVDTTKLNNNTTRFCAHRREVKAMWMELIRQQQYRLKEKIEALKSQEFDEPVLKEEEEEEETNHKTGKGVVAVAVNSDRNRAISLTHSQTPSYHTMTRFSILIKKDQNAFIILKDFHGIELFNKINEIDCFLKYNNVKLKGLRYNAIHHFLKTHLKTCKELVLLICFLIGPLLNLQKGLDSIGMSSTHTTTTSTSHAVGVMESGDDANTPISNTNHHHETLHDDDNGKSSSGDDGSDFVVSVDNVYGTTTSLGASFQMIRRAINTHQVSVLGKADTLVFLQTMIDLFHSFSCTLSQLFQVLETSDDSGDSISLSELERPFPGRVFESFAWSFGAASKVLLHGNVFGGLIRTTDEKLLEISGSTVKTALNDLFQLTFYSQSIEQVMSFTPSSHIDFKGSTAIADNMKGVQIRIKVTLDERWHYDKLTQIKTNVFSSSFFTNEVMENLVSRKRRFIREGTIRKVCRGGQIKPFVFWLLSDLLIYATPFSRSGKFTLNHTMELKHLKALPSTFVMPGDSLSGNKYNNNKKNDEDDQTKSSTMFTSRSTSTSVSSSLTSLFNKKDVFYYHPGDLVPGIEILGQEKTFISLFLNDIERNDWLKDIRKACSTCTDDHLGHHQKKHILKNEFRNDYDKFIKRPPNEIKTLNVTEIVERTITDENGKVTSSYIDYALAITTYGGEQWIVYKTYLNLLEFHRSCKKKKGGIACKAIERFPFPKKTVGKTSKLLQDRRKNAFQLYFRLLLELEQRPPELDSFLAAKTNV